MSERRQTTRNRSLLGGRIIFNNRNSSLDCVVRNLSPTGARIVLGSSVTVPDEFELYLPQKGKSRLARMKWRNPSEFGVEFLPETPGTVIETPDVTSRLRRLESEKAALQARVEQLSTAE